MRIVVSQLGARMHYGVARIFHSRAMLETLYTDIVTVRGWPRFLNYVPPGMRSSGLDRLLGRSPKDIPPDKIHAFSSLGVEYKLSLALAKSESERTAVHVKVGRRFAECVAKKGFRNATDVYAFLHAAYETLTAARKAGVRTILELPSLPKAVMEELMQPEYESYSDWEKAPRRDRSYQEMVEREECEIRCADTIIVPSMFVLESLRKTGVQTGRCEVVPYGVDDSFQAAPRCEHGGPLRVLTVGSVRLLKGPQYTAQAAELLGRQVDIRLVGASSMSQVGLSRLSKTLTLVGPVPRSKIMEHYQWADVFLLPSICEGMATVLIEALAAGLPVITTPNAGLDIRNGVEGFLIPIRDPNAIACRLSEISSDRSLLFDMSQNARERAREFMLDAYGDRLFSALNSRTN